MRSRVQKWGNSLALRIPKSIADEAGIRKDTPIEVSVSDGKVVITLVRKSNLNVDLITKAIKEQLQLLGIQEDTCFELSLADGKWVITQVADPKLPLKQLLAKVTEENLHHEVDSGPATGNETW